MTQFFFGKKLQIKKNISTNLQYVSGIGKVKAKYICSQCGILYSTKWEQLTEKQIFSIISWIEKIFSKKNVYGPELLKKEKNRKQFLISLKTTKGFRLTKGLPVNGQRTHTNGKTAKRLNKNNKK